MIPSQTRNPPRIVIYASRRTISCFSNVCCVVCVVQHLVLGSILHLAGFNMRNTVSVYSCVVLYLTINNLGTGGNYKLAESTYLGDKTTTPVLGR